MALRRHLAVAALLVLIAVLVALGVWQLQRRTWKLALIAQVEQRLAASPVAAPGPAQWAGIGKSDVYTRVVVRGRWRPVKPVLTQATTALGGGYWVMAPLDTARGFTVLVNRGFVPLEDKRDLRPPPGPVAITGLLRLTEPKGGFLRANVPAEDRWYSRDVAAIATRLNADRPLDDCRPRGGGDPCLSAVKHRSDMVPRLRGDDGRGEPVAPYFIDADAVPGQPWPRGGMTVVRFPNNHLVYALTWFAMAALLAFATGRVVGRVAGFRRDG